MRNEILPRTENGAADVDLVKALELLDQVRRTIQLKVQAAGTATWLICKIDEAMKHIEAGKKLPDQTSAQPAAGRTHHVSGAGETKRPG